MPLERDKYFVSSIISDIFETAMKQGFSITMPASMKRTLLLGSAIGLLGLGVALPASAQEDDRFPVAVEDTPPVMQAGTESSDDMSYQPAEPQNIMAPVVENTASDVPEQMMTQDGTQDGLPAIDPLSDPDMFYDSLPVTRGTQSTTPEKVNPSEKPAAKYIIVTKDYDRDDNKSLLVAANRALKLGRYDSALDMYDRLYEKNPRDARVLMGRAIALQKLGRVQLAIKTYEDLLEVDPGNIEAEVSMLGLVRERYPALALKQLATLFDKNPNNAALAAQVGLTYADVGNTEDAKRYLGSAISLDPNNAGYYYNMAVISDRAKDYRNAIRFYEEALSKDSIYGGSRSVPRDVIYDRLAILRQR